MAIQGHVATRQLPLQIQMQNVSSAAFSSNRSYVHMCGAEMVRPCLFAGILRWFLVGVSHAADDADCVEGFSNNMLQLGPAQIHAKEHFCGHLLVDRCDPQAYVWCNNNCRLHTHGPDCHRPLPDVMAENPGIDGYCYFNATAGWLVYEGPTSDFEAHAARTIQLFRDSSYKGLNTGTITTYNNFEGSGNLTTHADSLNYYFDDLYGYSLGFLQGQGLHSGWMRNSSFWVSLSKRKCDEIQASYQFSKEELVLADWLDNFAVISIKTMCSTDDYLCPGSPNPEVNRMAGWRNRADCRPVTHREFAKHFYVICKQDDMAKSVILKAKGLQLNSMRLISTISYTFPGWSNLYLNSARLLLR